MLCITFIITLTSLPTTVDLLFFFVVDRVTRHILKVQLLVTFQLVLLNMIEVISGANWCDNMRNKIWGGSACVSLNIILLCSVDFVLVRLALLT